MARTNYSYEKRLRELEKQKKKEEKRLKKLVEKEADGPEDEASSTQAGDGLPQS